MALKIYVLTELGNQIAQSPHNPNDVAYKVLYYLNRVGRATPDQLRMQTGAGYGTIASLERDRYIMDAMNLQKVPS